MMEVDEPPTLTAPARHVSAKVQPWVEKYRPKTVDDVSHQEDVVRTLKNAIATGVLPHLLFYGPPGTGKTSTILAVARTLFGPDIYRQRILELNASDERGISVVRDKVKTFAQLSVGPVSSMPGYPCPPFKLIILDEADTMTPDAQAALRRTMETYSRVTRFCLICNYVTRIIEPLASRCAKFRFRALSREPMLDRLRLISREENVTAAADALGAIVDLSGGDMRKAVTTLQSAHQLYGPDGSVTKDSVAELAGTVPAPHMQKLWTAIRSATFATLQSAVDDEMCEGFPLSALLHRLLEDVVADNDIADHRKAAICERLAQADKALVDGASEYMQLLDVTALIQRKLAEAPAS
ncbi:unnamed protein product [Phaeothamnion confervicola]